MAKSTGIVLTATGISFGNEWVNSGDPNFRILMAGLGTALVFSGIEKLSKEGAVGLSVMMLITVLTVPVDGKSPFQTLDGLMTTKAAKKAAKPKVKVPPK